jgi:hypothetical protein
VGHRVRILEEGRGKREEGRGKREEGRGKREEGRGMREQNKSARLSAGRFVVSIAYSLLPVLRIVELVGAGAVWY